MDTAKNFLLDIKDRTAYLTVNRPEKLNALNRDTLSELSKLLGFLEQEQRVLGIILTGAGDRAFVAGADIAEFKGLSEAEAFDLATWGHRHVMDVIYNFPKPIIAAVNGFALGGGLELAMACHLRVASDQAKMGLPEVSLGIIPGYGGTQRLPELVGRGKALEMILTGDMLDASASLQWGLVNYVVPADELIRKCDELLQKMYLKSPKALSLAIRSVNKGLQSPKEGYDEEIKAFAEAFGTADFVEGVAAFLEKRKPKF
ncbi:enoyl-CoA hydratase/isomerase family protein [Sphingobacterium sp. LRF_L2]|uniref:enoyl-CoA hydratase/isomerase family protein n=1 Tax=Sphingobacterium sp. LRF_L2 TaxID=3369421 RepID=UPI003F632639